MFNSRKIILLLFLALLLSACSASSELINPTSTASASPLAPEIATPTPEPAPIMALVNGEAISEESYSLSLSLYLEALNETGTFLATEGIEQIVLNDLIARSLLSQAARAAGFSATDEIVSQRLQAAIEKAGGPSAYEAWLARFAYTAASFESELRIEIEAAWMRNEIIIAVPTHAEQVEARQILLTEEFQAQRLLDQLQGGTPFETVVINNDPQGLGYLGWFPKGFLLQPEVEAAAFALQVGEFSQIIATEIGFHLIELLDRDANRELNPQARLELQRQALAQWVADQRQQSEIEVLLPQ